MKKGYNGIKLAAVLSCILLISGIAAKIMSVPWIFVSIVTPFVCVAILPFCSKHESIWLFLFIVLGSIPINVKITKSVMSFGLFGMPFPIIGPILEAIETYLILLSLEEVIFGVIGRFIWRRQYKVRV